MKYIIVFLLSFLSIHALRDDGFLADEHYQEDPETLIQRIKDFLGSETVVVFSKTSPSNADIYRSEAEMFLNRGIKLTIHKVVTPDNYILTLWRVASVIPPPITRTRYPIILQHGLLDSSFSWILNQKDQSLGYILPALGYDVWLTNNRGNKYSNEHKSLKTSDEAFWKFSFDEMGKYDLPASVEYIKTVTGSSKVIYIGHSQGTTQLFAHLTENPEFKNNLRGFFGLGPVIKADHQNSQLVSTIEKSRIVDIMNFFGFKSIMYIPFDTVPALGIACEKLSGLCADVVRSFCGNSDKIHYSLDRMGVMASHEPGGTSSQDIIHWSQLMRTGEFRKYDYGLVGNLEKYGSISAPLYDVNKLMQFDVEKHLYIGGKDYLANSIDYQFLLQHLPAASTFSHSIPDYSHLDYVWGTDAYDLIYKDLIQILERME